MRIFHFEDRKKERHTTALLVRSEHISGVDKMMRQEEQA